VAHVHWKKGTFFGESLANAFIEKSSYKSINGITRKVIIYSYICINSVKLILTLQAKRNLAKIMEKLEIQQQFECIHSTHMNKKLFFNTSELKQIKSNNTNLSNQLSENYIQNYDQNYLYYFLFTILTVILGILIMKLVN